MTENNKRILSGPIYKTLIAVTVPIMLANIIQTLYQLIDSFWVGRLGADAVAAVGISFPIWSLMFSFGFGLAIAGTILISQYNGRGDRQMVDLLSSQTLSLVTLISIVLGFLGFALSGWLVSLFTSDPIVLAQGIVYSKVTFLALPFMFIYFVFQSNMRGVGSVKVPMFIVLFTVVVNFFIDPIFMYGYGPVPALGVAGVAWATFATEALAAFVGIALLISGKYGIGLHWRDLKPRFKWMKSIFRLGAPSSLEHMTYSIEPLSIMAIVATFGTLAVASYSLGMRIFYFVIIPAVSFHIAITTLVGNNLGAGQFDRADKFSKVAMKTSFVFLTLVGLVLFVFAREIVGIFISGEVDVVLEATRFVRVNAFAFCLIGVRMVMNGVLKASGRTGLVMSLSFLNVISFVFFAYLFGIVLNGGLLGVWLSYPTTIVVTFVVAWFVYMRTDWKDTIGDRG